MTARLLDVSPYTKPLNENPTGKSVGEIRKNLSGLGVITYDFIENNSLVKKVTLSELVDYILDNFCFSISGRDSIRVALLESIKRKRFYLDELDKKYHNSLIYLFNQYKLLTKDS